MTTKKTTKDVTKRPSGKKKRKKTSRRRRPMWERSPSERATDDALYLRNLVPVMRELGVTWFADVELGPVGTATGRCFGMYTEGETSHRCALPCNHPGNHRAKDGSEFGPVTEAGGPL